MSVTTRLATMDDYEAICRLLTQGDAYHAQLVPSIFQPYDGPGRPREFIARFIEGEEADFLLAERDGVIVGVANVQIKESPKRPMFRPRRWALMDDVAVDEACRREGVGTALLEAARNWALKRHLATLQLTVWSANHIAISCYAKHGFKPLIQRMELALDPSEGPR